MHERKFWKLNCDLQASSLLKTHKFGRKKKASKGLSACEKKSKTPTSLETGQGQGKAEWSKCICSETRLGRRFPFQQDNEPKHIQQMMSVHPWSMFNLLECERTCREVIYRISPNPGVQILWHHNQEYWRL